MTTKSDRRDRRMHIYVNDRANKIVRSECKKNDVTIADYIASTALSFHTSDVPQKLDTTLKKIKRYMNRKGIAYQQRRANNGK